MLQQNEYMRVDKRRFNERRSLLVAFYVEQEASRICLLTAEHDKKASQLAS